jgi:hypothetical protein
MFGHTRINSRSLVLRLTTVLWVSLLLLGSGFVSEEHDCTSPKHNSHCAICWNSYSSGDDAVAAADNPVLPTKPAEVLPVPLPVCSLPLLSSDSRAPPAA